jgi:hypothetical protein
MAVGDRQAAVGGRPAADTISRRFAIAAQSSLCSTITRFVPNRELVRLVEGFYF